MGFQPQFITPMSSGLQQDKKPFLFLDNAFQTLQNAYAWRDRIKKREGNQLMGRLRRVFVSESAGNVTIGAGTTVFNIYTQLGIAGEANAALEPGNFTTITLVIGAPVSQTWTDSTGTGVMTGFPVPGDITSVSINYATGDVTVINGGVGFAIATLTVSLAYYPSLPVMGITQREIANVNNEQSITYDTKYAYTFVNEEFQEFISGTTWAGTDNDFFWSTNYRGSTPSDRLYFVTNFVNDANNPIRYTDGTTWTSFNPLVSATDNLYQTRILIPYYGRLLALNVWEGTTAGGYGGAVNIFNRCRFSQVGSPIAVDAWRSDEFGKGGFIDAPVNQDIISAAFYKNVLIVFFERSTWQLRYVGEYGLPFLWERISNDFGCESTFSPIIFDEGVLAVGDRAIVSSDGNTVQRIDFQIPDIVFSFKNDNNDHRRVHGIRDFRKEVVFWCYPASQLNRKFPNFTLLYNYRNNTYAIFRNNVTAFGKIYSPSGVSWDSQDVTWNDDIQWNTFLQEEYLDTVSGNQQGYIHFFGDPNTETIADSSVSAFDQESLYISNIDRSVTPVQLTVINHNLEDGETIYITDLTFVDTATGVTVSTDLNDNLYGVQRIDDDTIALVKWDFTSDPHQYINNFSYTPASGTGTYMGRGQITLFPKINITTKDFNPLMQVGLQTKFGHLDFLTDATQNAEITVELYRDTSLETVANLNIGQKNMETALTSFGVITGATQANPCQITTRSPHGLSNGSTILIDEVVGMTELNGNTYVITVVDSLNFTLNVDSTAFTTYTSGGEWTQVNYPYYVDGSSYTWHRFYAGTQGNFFTIRLTYNDDLMNTFSTHQQDFVLNAMRFWIKPAGKGVF